MTLTVWQKAIAEKPVVECSPIAHKKHKNYIADNELDPLLWQDDLVGVETHFRLERLRPCQSIEVAPFEVEALTKQHLYNAFQYLKRKGNDKIKYILIYHKMFGVYELTRLW